jgi:hypothetical protein
MSKYLVYICDWLPPDFGAVGQYAMLEAQWPSRRSASWSPAVYTQPRCRECDQVIRACRL